MNSNDQAAILLNTIEGLSLYRIFSKGPGLTIAHMLEDSLRNIRPSTVDLAPRLFRELTAWAETSGIPPAGSLWQNFLLDQVILDDNSFTKMASVSMLSTGSSLSGLVYEAAGKDLLGLKYVFDLDLSELLPGREENQFWGLINSPLESPDGDPRERGPESDILSLKKKLLEIPDWSLARSILNSFHLQSGSGIFCRYLAFRWDGPEKKLVGIQRPDPVRLENLIGYEGERAQVIENTERLLAGSPASNLLLYGDRGTGKSSTVKALIHRYGIKGLRIVEIPRHCLTDYLSIIQSLEGPGLKFILFVDDLSYEENETDYKALKSILDGSLQAKPDNVAIYATSNLRHLVREYFDDRKGDVHGGDTLQEKLSLSERFAVTVLFLSPDQELYLRIVEGLARQKGLALSSGELKARALEWERWNNGRSGRTARQFIDLLDSPS